MLLRTLALIVVAAGLARAQGPRAALSELVADPRLEGARVGVKVVDLADGAVLCEHDADKGFMTASNMKLISSAVGLFTLGPEFRFRTVLRARGEVRGGALRGDLVLVGSGDPTLGGRQEETPTAPFVRMARALAERGIEEVRGRVVGDDDCQPDEIMGDGWSWGYQGACYAAQVSGLCFTENCMKAAVQGTAPGKRPAVRLVPDTRYVTILNEARTVPEGKRAALAVERARATNLLRVRGTVRAGAEHHRSFSVENPTRYAAFVLRETLIDHGIEVHGGALDRDDVPGALRGERGRVVAEHRSAPLAEILVTLNKVSQNLYAEQLVRAASRQATGRSDMRAAAEHAERVLAELGVDTDGIAIADGSGLTRLNLVEPAQLAGLLIGIWRSEHRALFLSTLPVAGVDGTLRNRFEGSAARGRVRAKTGYISRVVALSGYVPRRRPDAQPIVFSVLLNNFTCPTSAAKAAVDRFVTALAEHAGWTAPARSR